MQSVGHTVDIVEIDGRTIVCVCVCVCVCSVEYFPGVLNRPSTISDAAIERLPQVATNADLDLPPSLQETIRAVQQLSSGKAPGSDTIPAEVYKHGGPQLMHHLTALFQEMWRQGEVPQDLKDATIVHLYKRKGNRQICDNHRVISLLNISGKIFAHILLNRQNNHLDQGLLSNSQCGFGSYRGTMDKNFAARQLQEKCQEMRTHLYSTFVDLTKAFDTVNREGLWKIMQKFGCPERFIEMVCQLHDADEPYTRLKEAIIQRVAKSANLMLRELFTQVELGDQTPSQLMRHMRSLLAGRDMDDAIFREIWLEKLPVPMQQVLAMLDSKTPLEKLATHADRIKECYPIGASCSNIQQPPPSKGKPHQGIDFYSEGPALPEHDTPYTEKAPCCCTTQRALTSAGPPRTPTDAYRTDYDDLRDTVRLLCTQVSNMCSALNSLQSARKQPYSHRRSKSLKRPRQPVMATTAAGPSRTSRLFYINDKSNGLRFLVDTGAEVSVIPPLRRHRLKPSQFSLKAANSTTISTYGQRSLTLDLGLH
ncbi:hypothetical protein SprV_1002878300 [Sparganum proliferum]